MQSAGRRATKVPRLYEPAPCVLEDDSDSDYDDSDLGDTSEDQDEVDIITPEDAAFVVPSTDPVPIEEPEEGEDDEEAEGEFSSCEEEEPLRVDAKRTFEEAGWDAGVWDKSSDSDYTTSSSCSVSSASESEPEPPKQ